MLGEHFAAGRLDLAELNIRVAAALAARYGDEVAAVVRDLPPLPSGLPNRLATGQRPGRGTRTDRRHAQADSPDPAWLPTSERFRDPSSGTVMRVWVDPATSTRYYVPDAPGPD